MSEEDDRRKVVAQYRVVAHLARQLALLSDDLALVFENGGHATILDMNGERSAGLMETLGDALNGMDAFTEEDEWTGPVFAEAHERWPKARQPAS